MDADQEVAPGLAVAGRGRPELLELAEGILDQVTAQTLTPPDQTTLGIFHHPIKDRRSTARSKIDDGLRDRR